jgi:hypothetical protein
MGNLGGNMNRFRFQDLEIWKESIEIGDILFDIADKLEENALSPIRPYQDAGPHYQGNPRNAIK